MDKETVTGEFMDGVYFLPVDDMPDCPVSDPTITLYPFIALKEPDSLRIGYAVVIHELGFGCAFGLSPKDAEVLKKIESIALVGQSGTIRIDLNRECYKGVKKQVDKLANWILKNGAPETEKDLRRFYRYAQAVFETALGMN